MDHTLHKAIVRSETALFSFVYQDETGTAVDLTGVSGKLEYVDAGGTAATIDFAVDSAAGVVKAAIPDTTTDTLELGPGRWRILLDWPSGGDLDRSVFLEGTFTVSERLDTGDT